MTVKGYYRNLLSNINVTSDELADARDRRNELREKLEEVVGEHASGVETFAAGALAAGSQIAPLNDVDVVVSVPDFLAGWGDDPDGAREDVLSWLEPTIDAEFEVSTHAIKLTYPDEDFTADVVIGVCRKKGIVIPRCPEDEESSWMETDPKRHAELVRERNLKDRPALFSQQLRILKALNQQWALASRANRKPLSSFHVTALALAIFPKGKETPHDEGTPMFLEQAADLVLGPLPNPAGVGPDLEARDPKNASELLADAAEKTRQALELPDADAVAMLDLVFGDHEQRAALLSRQPLGVTRSGRFVPAAAPAVERAVPHVSSHGEE